MLYYGNNDYRDYLAHYGVIGMRWGIRRYQPYSYTAYRGSERVGKELGQAKEIAKKAAKAAGEGALKAAKTAGRGAKAAVKKASEMNKAHQEKVREKKRRKIIDSGTIDQIKKERGKLLTEDDVKAAIQRIRDDFTLDDLAREEGRKAIERGKKALSDLADITKSALSIYTNVSSFAKNVREGTKTEEKRAKEIRDLLDKADFAELHTRKDLTKKEKEAVKRAEEVYEQMQQREWDKLVDRGDLSISELERASKYRTNMDKLAGKNDDETMTVTDPDTGEEIEVFRKKSKKKKGS